MNKIKVILFDLDGTLSDPAHGLLDGFVYAFKKLGIRFNEDLTTTEDWDFLMRTAFVTGVSNSQQVTSLYRIWKNDENSYAAHSKKDWLVNEQFIRESFEKMPIVLPNGCISEFQSQSFAIDNDAFQTTFSQSLLYFDEGNGFSQENTLQGAYKNASKVLTFENFSDGKIYSIRFDLTDARLIWVSNIEINVFTRSGDLLSYTIENVKTNGLKIKNGVFFFRRDPQVIISFKEPIDISRVEVRCKIVSSKKAIIRKGLRRLCRATK